MDTIPLFYLKAGKIEKSSNNKKIQKKESATQVFLDTAQKYKHVYIIDIDGYRTNRANLDIYRSLSKKISFWVDSAPRTPGDVMDLFISGVHRITLIWKIMDDPYLEEIREMCTGEIYLATKDEFSQTLKKVKKIGFDGIIVKGTPHIWQTINKPVWYINTDNNGKAMVQRYKQKK